MRDIQGIIAYHFAGCAQASQQFCYYGSMQEESNSISSPRRREPHIKVALPVRLWGMDASGSPFVQNVFTSDISTTGASVSGVTARLNVGEIIGVQHGAEKARFRVIRMKPIEGVGFELGLHAVDETKCLWRSHLVIPIQLGESPTPCDRRRNVRIPCNGSAEFCQTGNSYRMWATATDLSGGGCYLQTVSTLSVDTQLELKISIDHTDVNCAAVVRTSHPNIGMGLQFQELDIENQQKLHLILETLEAAQGENLPPYMRVLAHIERTRECLLMIDKLIRQNPTRIPEGMAELIAGVQAKVNELFLQQRSAAVELMAGEIKM
ncbi:MAG TPA: PilZ domain-containing protein [Candidatus Acidoferrales bacterium]|nr:PilZ domain-containing protein [Candidatus Acidoferrales bacterium]